MNEPSPDPVVDEPSADAAPAPDAIPSPDERPPPDDTLPAGGQVILVRRRRTPALGFWVALALAVTFLTGIVVAWTVGVRHGAGMLYFGVVSAAFIGFPLAMVAAVVDAVIHRRRG